MYSYYGPHPFVFLKRCIVRAARRIRSSIPGLSFEIVSFLHDNYDLFVLDKSSQCKVTELSPITPYPDIVTTRGSFKVSGILRRTEFTHKFLYKTKKGKVVLTVYDYTHVQKTFEFRAQLDQFLCKFSPKFSVWLSRENPYYVYKRDSTPFVDYCMPDSQNVQFHSSSVDFSPYVYAFSLNMDEDKKDEVPLQFALDSFKRELENKSAEINALLTGNEHDGAYVLKDCPLAEGLICYDCNTPVFSTKERGYKFVCPHCGERDATLGQVRQIPLKDWEKLVQYNSEYFDHLCCPQDSIL